MKNAASTSRRNTIVLAASTVVPSSELKLVNTAKAVVRQKVRIVMSAFKRVMATGRSRCRTSLRSHATGRPARRKMTTATASMYWLSAVAKPAPCAASPMRMM